MPARRPPSPAMPPWGPSGTALRHRVPCAPVVLPLAVRCLRPGPPAICPLRLPPPLPPPRFRSSATPRSGSGSPHGAGDDAAWPLGFLRARSEPLPQLGTLPAFTFTRQDGSALRAEQQLQGRPFVANFIFTRCPTVCPVFTQKMARVQERRRRRWAPARSSSPSRWTPPTTPRSAWPTTPRSTAPTRPAGASSPATTRQLKDTIVSGFKICMGREPGDEDGPDGHLPRHPLRARGRHGRDSRLLRQRATTRPSSGCCVTRRGWPERTAKRRKRRRASPA